MDGGLGQLLLNDGTGQFSAIEPAISGIEVPGDAKSLTLSDIDQDGRPDLVFGMNDAKTITYLNRAGEKPLAVHLVSKPGNPTAIGARVEIGGQIQELQAGGGYLSQSAPILYFSSPPDAVTASVRWPDGSLSEHPIDAGAMQAKLSQP